MPPDILGCTFKLIVSNSVKLWDVDTATWPIIFCALPKTWVWFDFNKYSKLSLGAVLKNIVSPFFSVDKPTKLFEILLANTVDPFVRLKLDDDAKVVPVPHCKAPAPVGTVNVNCWLFTNGWLGKNILFAGTLITLDVSPSVNDLAIAMAVPAVNAKPTCSWGLKNTLSFTLESKGGVTNGIVNFWGTVKIADDKSWEAVFAVDTRPLFTLNICFSSKTFRTNNLSVPIPILLPAETLSGILETYMSVTIPDVLFAPINL